MIHNEWTREFMVIVCSLQVALHGSRTCIRLLLLTTDRWYRNKTRTNDIVVAMTMCVDAHFSIMFFRCQKTSRHRFSLSHPLCPALNALGMCRQHGPMCDQRELMFILKFIFYGLIFCRTAKHSRTHSLWRVLCRAGGRVINRVNFSVTIRWRSQIATRIHHSPFDS